jgi:hypothetical protein
MTPRLKAGGLGCPDGSSNRVFYLTSKFKAPRSNNSTALSKKKKKWRIQENGTISLRCWKKCQHRTLYTAKISFRNEKGEIITFSDQENQEFKKIHC